MHKCTNANCPEFLSHVWYWYWSWLPLPLQFAICKNKEEEEEEDPAEIQLEALRAAVRQQLGRLIKLDKEQASKMVQVKNGI